jgi:hypothetical protein
MAVITTRAIQGVFFSHPLLEVLHGLDCSNVQAWPETQWLPALNSTPSGSIDIHDLRSSLLTQAQQMWENFEQVRSDLHFLHSVLQSMSNLPLPKFLLQCHKSFVKDIAVTVARLMSMQMGCQEFLTRLATSDIGTGQY